MAWLRACTDAQSGERLLTGMRTTLANRSTLPDDPRASGASACAIAKRISVSRYEIVSGTYARDQRRRTFESQLPNRDGSIRCVATHCFALRIQDLLEFHPILVDASQQIEQRALECQMRRALTKQPSTPPRPKWNRLGQHLED